MKKQRGAAEHQPPVQAVLVAKGSQWSGDCTHFQPPVGIGNLVIRGSFGLK